MITGCLFDVDGVLLASPHEQAWRVSLAGFVEPDRFTSQFYQAHVAGKPRLGRMRAALTALHVPDAGMHTASYAERKQKRLLEFLDGSSVIAFPDMFRLVRNIRRASA